MPREFSFTVTLRGFVLLLLTGIALCPGASAQNSRATLRGTVVDANGARLPSARIVAQEISSSARREAKADDNGEFRLDDLVPGTYRVVVSAAGFAQASSDVRVVISSVRDITVTLKPLAIHETVNVQGTLPSSITTTPVDLASAVQQGVVTVHDLQTIPLAHRSFANIAYLVPGTEPVEPSDPTKARITAVSFGGSSGLNVEASVDGGDNSDDYIGGFLQNFSPDSIQEFAVRTAQEEADTSRTTGGSVVITTRRGVNQWHGDLAFYERDAALNARYPIDNPSPAPKQPFSRQNYIAAAGGPIKRDKVWFFSSLEYVHEDASIAYSPASLAQFNALASLASQGLIPGVSSISVPNNVPVPFHDYLSMLRFDWAQSQRSQWFIRAANDNYTTRNDLVQQATLPSTGATSRSNYLSLVINQSYTFSPTWLGTLVFAANGLHHTETRNTDLGFALAFPFSSTFHTISGFETFGDNQFVTPITAFPVLRNQQKYQVRYDVSHAAGEHAPKFGITVIHEPVLSGALSGTAENLTIFPNDPTFYAANQAQFAADLNCGAGANPAAVCSSTPAGNGSFSQNVQRLGGYVQDSWRLRENVTVNYGVRYDTTFGLFTASGRSQLDNPALLTLKALQIPLVSGAPHDYRGGIAPRLGIAYSPGGRGKTVLRAGFGLFYNDLAQNGWVTAFQAVNSAPGICTNATNPATNPGCLPGAAGSSAISGGIIDPHYKTPYALHASAGAQHAFNSEWMISADYTHEEGNHAYRRYQYEAAHTLFTPLFPSSDVADQNAFVPNVAVFRTDNRSSYNAFTLHLQGNMRRFNLTANYTLASAKTWGCVLGELFDYVNGVCNPLHPFAAGDYGPSGEDVRHRFVLAGIVHAPAGFEITLLSQAESARPFTLITPVDVNGTGDPTNDRAVINGVQTSLDQFRGTPYFQVDMRVARPFRIGEHWSVAPFAEFFNLFNRSNPGANYVTNVGALPAPVDNPANAAAICSNPPACTQFQPITNLNQLKVPAGALGDFFGPGTTVGIPFAAQLGVRVNF